LERYLHLASGWKGSELVGIIGQGFSNSSTVWFCLPEGCQEIIDEVGVLVEAQQDVSSSSESIHTHALLNSSLDLFGLLFIQLSQANHSLKSTRFWSTDASVSLSHGDWWDRQ
jgi:hypothetical protein